MEYTLAMIKPDAVAQKKAGQIIARYELAGFNVVAMKLTRLSRQQAEVFYQVHKDRPFYASLTTFMSSGPIVVLLLQGEDIVARNRALMGATNPKEAATGTIRKDFATDVERNAVHGSDCPENASIEARFFFSDLEWIGIKD